MFIPIFHATLQLFPVPFTLMLLVMPLVLCFPVSSFHSLHRFVFLQHFFVIWEAFRFCFLQARSPHDHGCPPPPVDNDQFICENIHFDAKGRSPGHAVHQVDSMLIQQLAHARRQGVDQSEQPVAYVIPHRELSRHSSVEVAMYS